MGSLYADELEEATGLPLTPALPQCWVEKGHMCHLPCFPLMPLFQIYGEERRPK